MYCLDEREFINGNVNEGWVIDERIPAELWDSWLLLEEAILWQGRIEMIDADGKWDETKLETLFEKANRRLERRQETFDKELKSWNKDCNLDLRFGERSWRKEVYI